MGTAPLTESVSDSVISWKALRRRLPRKVVRLLRNAERRGHTVELCTSLQQAAAHFAARPVHEVHFRATNGIVHPEFRVILARNATILNGLDPKGTMRPPTDNAFTTYDEMPSSKLFLSAAFEGLHPKRYIDERDEWLTDHDLIVIPFRVGGKDADRRLLDGIYVAPKELAVAFLAWDLIHHVPSAEECLADFEPRVVFLNAQGLRHSLMGGVQNTSFYRHDSVLYISPNNTYMGLSMSKKPIFVAMSHFAAQEGAMAEHATLNEAAVTDARGAIVRVGTKYTARSACGKTEWGQAIHVDGHGQLILARHIETGEVITLHYPEERHARLLVGGDDGVYTKLVRTSNGFGEGRNWEIGGRFERPSASFKRGDLPDDDFIFDHATRYELFLLNYEAHPGSVVETHHRTIWENQRPHPNPRMSHRWDLLRRYGMDITTEPVEFQHSIYGMGLIPEWAMADLFNELPPDLATLVFIAGLTAAKSASVQPGKNDAAMMSDFGGTMNCFSLLTKVEHANAFWRQREAFFNVRYWVIPIRQFGCSYKLENSYSAEQFFRELLPHWEAGNAECTMELAASPLFGKRPSRLAFFGQVLPEHFLCARQQLGRTRYERMAHVFYEHYLQVLEPLLAFSDLEPGLRESIRRLQSIKVAGCTQEELEQIWRLFGGR